MRKLLLLFCLFFAFQANSQTFNLTWSDEFNTGNNVLPDATQWKNEVGVIRNGEWQYYTDKDIDNQVVKDGNLLIIGKKEEFNGQHYTSASVVTKSGWKYGRIESRFKMQTGMGIWACFWTMGLSAPNKGNNWPFCGEIDILEHINSEIPYHGTVHWWNESKTGNDKHQANGGTFPSPAGSYNPNEYNVYGIE
jgi:beta-glucanase (GH16 family)